jgi:hypothetical protein
MMIMATWGFALENASGSALGNLLPFLMTTALSFQLLLLLLWLI